MSEPEILTLAARDVRPLDMVDETRRVRCTRREGAVVEIEFGHLHGERRRDGYVHPVWVVEARQVYAANDELRVVRGMAPPVYDTTDEGSVSGVAAAEGAEK